MGGGGLSSDLWGFYVGKGGVSVAPPYIKHQSWYIASLKVLAHDPVSTVWTISSPPYMVFIYNLTSGNFEINPLILP